MPYSLKGRKVLITAGTRGLGAVVAQQFAAEGCDLFLNYVSNEERASKTKQDLQQSYPDAKILIQQGDMGVEADCARMVKEAIAGLGGLDIIISNAGWTKFSDFGDLHALAEQDWDKCWAVNVKGQMWLLRAALDQFNANPEGGVYLITSSVAAVTASGSTMAYSVTKAAGLHLMRCLAQTQGPKIRVNAVLPGLLLTEWGSHYSDEKVAGIKNQAVLKKETNLEDCAQAFVMAAKNSSLTGVKIQVDSGLFLGAS